MKWIAVEVSGGAAEASHAALAGEPVDEDHLAGKDSDQEAR